MVRAALIFVIGAIMLSTVVYLYGCGGSMGQIKTFDQMSPKEQATMVLSVYNDQYDLYLREATSADLTEARREVLRDKKKALVELEPYVGMFANYAVEGQFVPADTEAIVMRIMDRLLGIK